MNRILRIGIGECIRSFPLQFDPRWIADHEIKATIGEHVSKFQFPMEEPLLFTDLPDQLQTRMPCDELIEIDGVVHHIPMGFVIRDLSCSFVE